MKMSPEDDTIAQHLSQHEAIITAGKRERESNKKEIEPRTEPSPFPGMHSSSLMSLVSSQFSCELQL